MKVFQTDHLLAVIESKNARRSNRWWMIVLNLLAINVMKREEKEKRRREERFLFFLFLFVFIFLFRLSFIRRNFHRRWSKRTKQRIDLFGIECNIYIPMIIHYLNMRQVWKFTHAWSCSIVDHRRLLRLFRFIYYSFVDCSSSSKSHASSSCSISTWKSFTFTATIIDKWCWWNINTSTTGTQSNWSEYNSTSRNYLMVSFFVVVLDRTIQLQRKLSRRKNNRKRNEKIPTNLRSKRRKKKFVFRFIKKSFVFRPVSPYALFFRDTQNDIKKKLANPSFG